MLSPSKVTVPSQELPKGFPEKFSGMWVKSGREGLEGGEGECRAQLSCHCGHFAAEMLKVWVTSTKAALQVALGDRGHLRSGVPDLMLRVGSTTFCDPGHLTLGSSELASWSVKWNKNICFIDSRAQ